MPNDLLTLASDLEKLSKEVEQKTSKIVSNVVMTIVGDLAFKTPVDTSQAISNWIVTFDYPTDSTIEPHYPGMQGSTYAASAAETINRARQKLRNRKAGQVVFIANDLDYIQKLNSGSSSQQPAGFVERAVLLGRKMVKGF